MNIPNNEPNPNLLALRPDTSLYNGAYSVDSALGQGGFGITYRGEDTALRRTVAIKEFFPAGSTRRDRNVVPPASISAADFEAARETFLEEARLVARFQHPNIVDVYSVFSENNTVYMVMEYLAGDDLEKIVRLRGPLDEGQALALIQPVVSAVETLHGAGLLHQDIKPDNLILNSDGRVVLIDFGLTQKLDTTQGLGTVVFSGNTRAGTPGYAPLEQYGRQARVGTYTDVYALAATTYYLLTGQTPPEATDRASGEQLTDVRALNSGVSKTVGEAVMRGLAMQVEARPQTAADFLSLLQREEPAFQPSAPRPAPAPPPRPQTQVQEHEVEPMPRWDFETIFGAPPGGNQPQRRAPQPPPQDPFFDPFARQRPQPRIVTSGCGGCNGCGCITTILLFIFLNLIGALFGGVRIIGF
ncbi:MAG TPA: serine/threonine-protein kinase [Abditibacteriaceae bacterium]|jgi:serine/threonine protein kinase